MEGAQPSWVALGRRPPEQPFLCTSRMWSWWELGGERWLQAWSEGAWPRSRPDLPIPCPCPSPVHCWWRPSPACPLCSRDDTPGPGPGLAVLGGRPLHVANTPSHGSRVTVVLPAGQCGGE